MCGCVHSTAYPHFKLSTTTCVSFQHLSYAQSDCYLHSFLCSNHLASFGEMRHVADRKKAELLARVRSIQTSALPTSIMVSRL